MLEEVTQMLWWGSWKSRRLMLLRSKLFYCLRLPIHPLLQGGDPNTMLGVIKVLGFNTEGRSNWTDRITPWWTNEKIRNQMIFPNNLLVLQEISSDLVCFRAAFCIEQNIPEDKMVLQWLSVLLEQNIPEDKLALQWFSVFFIKSI